MCANMFTLELRVCAAACPGLLMGRWGCWRRWSQDRCRSLRLEQIAAGRRCCLAAFGQRDYRRSSTAEARPRLYLSTSPEGALPVPASNLTVCPAGVYHDHTWTYNLPHLFAHAARVMRPTVVLMPQATSG